jgi:hypothetical protein
LTATSSDTVLVPSANITISGSGVDRVLEITPAAHRTGVTTITVSVTDGREVATSRFDLIVNAIPTLNELIDHIMMEKRSAIIPLTIADEETPASNLLLVASSANVSLLPNNRIAFGGSGAERYLSVTPSANRFGTTTISVTVGDEGCGFDAFVSLTVLAETPPPLDQPQRAGSGERVFQVTGRGLGPLRYQWLHNGRSVRRECEYARHPASATLRCRPL